MEKRITFTVEPKIHFKVKKKALMYGLTIRELMLKMIETFVKDQKVRKTAKIAILLFLLIIPQLEAQIVAENSHFLANNGIKNVKSNFANIVDSIYLTEGGKNTNFPYGIKSVKCSGEKECRKVCLNTVRNNYKRWLASDQKKTYLEFLRDHYAPLSDSQLNKNWLKNVTYFMDAK